MSEYIPKYPSEEGDDSNKTSSELLAETLKPIYVPQDLMLAWESHLASYSRDTYVLLDQVRDSEAALNAQYQALLARVQKYEQMLQDITMDSNEFTMDTDEVNFTGWNILAQASYWDYLLRKEITKLRDQIKSAEYKGELVADVSNSVLESLATGNQHITNIIGALTDSPLIRDLDAALSSTSTSLSELRSAHEALKAKQYADAIALADQNGQTFDQLTLTFNNLISEQIGRLADEAATRTSALQVLEDGIAAEAQLRYEGQEAIASQVLAIKTSTETAVAGILQDYSTIAGTNEAITTALNAYSAEVDGTIATILTDYVSYANLDSALTSKTDKLLSIINDNIAQLNITNEISAGLSSIKALSTVSVDLNGVIAGYGLISELENGVVTSAFGVNADSFYIGKPTDEVKPFVVTTVPKNIDGIDFPAGTWINSAIIADATIGTAHINDASITNAKIASLDASKITAGFINADRIQAGSIDATKMRILDNTNLWVNRYLDYTPATIEGTSIASGGISGNRAVMASRDHVGSLNTRYALRAGDTIVTEFSARQDKGTATPLNAGVWCTNTVNMMTQLLYPAASEIADLGNGWKRYRTVVKVTEAATEYGKLFFQIEQNASGGSLGYSVSDITQRRASGGELIVDGAITANKLQVDELSAISANLGTIQVDSANISRGAITTAKIGDLQVDTLKIADRAVTAPHFISKAGITPIQRGPYDYAPNSYPVTTFLDWGLTGLPPDQYTMVTIRGSIGVAIDGELSRVTAGSRMYILIGDTYVYNKHVTVGEQIWSSTYWGAAPETGQAQTLLVKTDSAGNLKIKAVFGATTHDRYRTVMLSHTDLYMNVLELKK